MTLEVNQDCTYRINAASGVQYTYPSSTADVYFKDGTVALVARVG